MKGGNITFFFKGDDADLNKKTGEVSSKLGSIAKSVGSAFVKGSVVAGTALTGMVAMGVKAYADMEQNIGGVETLFKDNADALIENANRAYKTAGVSANQYMSQATSFSASLLQSLSGDTKKAVDYADMAIIDMADNANKMGTDMSLIQNAYQGFAKQNFMMLDNLKLGYGGTKTEMERLIADANKIKKANGQMANLSVKNFSDMVEAIHVIQENMGITGTTALEASETISGSISSAKSAWENFLSGTGSIDEVVDTFITAGKNIGNAIVKLAPNIVNGIVSLVNQLIPKIPPLIEQFLPIVVNGVINLFDGILNMLPALIEMLGTMFPAILQTLINGVVNITNQLSAMLPTLIPQIVGAIMLIIPVLLDNIPLLLDCAVQLIEAFTQGLMDAIPILVQEAPEVITKLVDALVYFSNVLAFKIPFALIKEIASGFVKNIPKVIEKLPQLIKEIVKWFTSGSWVPDIAKKGWEIGENLVKGMLNGFKSMKNKLIDSATSVGGDMLKAMKKKLGIHSPSTEFAFIGKMNAEGLIEGMDSMQKDVNTSMNNMLDLSPQLYGSAQTNLSPIVNVYNDFNLETDPLGQVVRRVKTYSGGAKNDYNYGTGLA